MGKVLVSFIIAIAICAIIGYFMEKTGMTFQSYSH